MEVDTEITNGDIVLVYDFDPATWAVGVVFLQRVQREVASWGPELEFEDIHRSFMRVYDLRYRDWDPDPVSRKTHRLFKIGSILSCVTEREWDCLASEWRLDLDPEGGVS